MDAQCDFIYAWSPGRLTEMADFAGKRVLDVGAGSGRLGFAVAHLAQEVYLSEPVDTLREYLRDKIARLGLTNVRVCDGMAHSLPFPDDCFDIVLATVVNYDFYNVAPLETEDFLTACLPELLNNLSIPIFLLLLGKITVERAISIIETKILDKRGTIL